MGLRRSLYFLVFYLFTSCRAGLVNSTDTTPKNDAER
jgi:hypothetical protein